MTGKESFEEGILEREGMRSMPFSVPEGYFEGFRVDVSHARHAFRGRIIALAATVAASVAIIVSAAAWQLSFPKADPTGLAEYGTWFYADMIPVTDPDMIYVVGEDTGDDFLLADACTDMDIIEYLIYSGCRADDTGLDLELETDSL